MPWKPRWRGRLQLIPIWRSVQCHATSWKIPCTFPYAGRGTALLYSLMRFHPEIAATTAITPTLLSADRSTFQDLGVLDGFLPTDLHAALGTAEGDPDSRDDDLPRGRTIAEGW
ncbi:hypothetical protein C2E23DRAFT_620980 [Lenzites betulinus]|nr:hypothetical protein C2E23DRAFT_620980 [Lenzites betulinus]